MGDKFSRKTRSKIMSAIRSNCTKPELILKNKLQGLYFRYQPKIYGKPDFASRKKKMVIFVDGCFWHKCEKCYKEPKSNRAYWLPKIKRNVARAKEVTRHYKKNGWDVIRIWEHSLNKTPNKSYKRIKNAISLKTGKSL